MPQNLKKKSSYKRIPKADIEATKIKRESEVLKPKIKMHDLIEAETIRVKEAQQNINEEKIFNKEEAFRILWGDN